MLRPIYVLRIVLFFVAVTSFADPKVHTSLFFTKGSITNLYVSPDGEFIVASKPDDISVSIDKGKTWKTYSLVLDAKKLKINSFFVRGQRLYTATDEGVVFQKNMTSNEWFFAKTAGGPVYAVFANETNLFVGTEQGLIVNNLNISLKWVTKGKNDGLVEKTIRGIWGTDYTRIHIWAKNDDESKNSFFISHDGGHNWHTHPIMAKDEIRAVIKDNELTDVYISESGKIAYFKTADRYFQTDSYGKDWTYPAKDFPYFYRRKEQEFYSINNNRFAFEDKSGHMEGLLVAKGITKTYNLRTIGFAPRIKQIYIATDDGLFTTFTESERWQWQCIGW